MNLITHPTNIFYIFNVLFVQTRRRLRKSFRISLVINSLIHVRLNILFGVLIRSRVFMNEYFEDESSFWRTKDKLDFLFIILRITLIAKITLE